MNLHTYQIDNTVQEAIRLLAVALASEDRHDTLNREGLERLLKGAGVIEEGFRLGAVLTDISPGKVEVIAIVDEEDGDANYSSTIDLETGAITYYSKEPA